MIHSLSFGFWTVQAIVLETEKQIIDDSDESQDDFNYIKSILNRQPSTCEREDPAKEIQENR